MISNLMFKNTFLFLFVLFVSCGNSQNKSTPLSKKDYTIQVGAERTEQYLHLLKNKKVGILTNQTGIVPISKSSESQSIVDYLLENDVNLTVIFAPEHGFRGTANAGEHVKDDKDSKTGLPIISLYGNSKKPKPAQLKGVDIMLFDLQDVGARFYTYISSLHYLMEACAENKIPLIILDRPNPNGSYVDGPILNMKYKSFVGMHPIPILHGMTIGEYGKMINGEKWLNKGIQCDLTVISCGNYTKNAQYDLPIPPSPNLPNMQSIRLYTSLCLFEGTNVSSGRGTNKQFQIYGSPYLKNMPYSFTPKPNSASKEPMNNGKLCYGEDLSKEKTISPFEIKWLLKAYKNSSEKNKFFNNFFIKLAGTDQFRSQIEKGLSEKEIRASWEKGIESFKETRKAYLIYAE